VPHADLHVHTTRSDGQLTLERLPAAASRAGVAVTAVTDHDRLHPDLDAPVVERDGVRIVNGVELRVEAPHERLDLLGYGVDPDAAAALRAECRRLQDDRIERARAMVDGVERRLGIDLDVDFEPGVGRPHVAGAVDAHPDTDLDYGDAFDELIGDGGPCFVARDVPDVERGLSLLREACGVVSLAHPLRYDDPAAALEFAPRCDAVEGPYPYAADVDETLVDEAVAEHDLLLTGGSDAHDDRLGLAGLSEAQFDRVAAHL
jgi:predicted metal-dependent phosphoesterase TrpH